MSAMTVPLETAVRSMGYSGRGVAQPGSAPALGQRTPIPTAPFCCTDFHSFQQLGESAFRSERSSSVSTMGVLRQFCDSGPATTCVCHPDPGARRCIRSHEPSPGRTRSVGGCRPGAGAAGTGAAVHTRCCVRPRDRARHRQSGQRGACRASPGRVARKFCQQAPIHATRPPRTDDSNSATSPATYQLLASRPSVPGISAAASGSTPLTVLAGQTVRGIDLTVGPLPRRRAFKGA